LPTEPLRIDQTAFRARALLIGERLDLRSWENVETLATTPLAVALHGNGVAVLFRYGAVVFFNAAPQDEISFLEAIRPKIVNAYAAPETESVEIRVSPAAKETISSGIVTLEKLTIERLQLIADALAKSVVLALYESRVAAAFERTEPLARQLEQAGKIGGRPRELLKHIGSTLQVDHLMVGRVAVVEKPELLWERPELEGLFIRLEDEFELRERHEILEQKLRVLSRTAETLLELIHSRHALRVEWYIVILIVVEIILTLYGMFVGYSH
jgi:uncharacterized Rmd1/YagE family protein